MSGYENIKNKGFDKRTTEEQREIAKKGGVASGKARNKKKEFRELLEKMLSEEGGHLNGEIVSRKEMVVARTIKILTDPDSANVKEFLKAFEIVRDTIGEKPIERIQVAEVDEEILKQVENMVLIDDE